MFTLIQYLYNNYRNSIDRITTVLKIREIMEFFVKEIENGQENQGKVREFRQIFSKIKFFVFKKV